MAYATVEDVQARISYTMDASQTQQCEYLLDDAAVLIDSFENQGTEDAKRVVSCRMVIRALGADDAANVPIGASQGSMSALGYSQSWTIGSGTVGELYLSKVEKRMLGIGNAVGSYSPVQELAVVRND